MSIHAEPMNQAVTDQVAALIEEVTWLRSRVSKLEEQVHDLEQTGPA